VNILRVLRRRKIRLSFIFILLVVFIANTYAWMSTETDSSIGHIELSVLDWGVEFVINDEEITTEEYVFEIPEFHPGIEPIEKKIYVYNIGDADSELEYEITDIYLYGEQIYKRTIDAENSIPETIAEETTNAENRKTANLFGREEATIFDEGNANYSFSLRYPTPFEISYTYDKVYLTGKDRLDSATSWMTINLAWDNYETNNEEDTRLGNMVYDFENAVDANGNLLHEGEPALKIIAKVTATRVR